MSERSTMSLREGAAYLGIGYDQMCDLVREGRIATVCFIKRKRLTVAILDAFIAANTSGPIVGPTEESTLPEVPVNKGRLTKGRKFSTGKPYQWMQRHAAK